MTKYALADSDVSIKFLWDFTQIQQIHTSAAAKCTFEFNLKSLIYRNRGSRRLHCASTPTLQRTFQQIVRLASLVITLQQIEPANNWNTQVRKLKAWYQSWRFLRACMWVSVEAYLNIVKNGEKIDVMLERWHVPFHRPTVGLRLVIKIVFGCLYSVHPGVLL